MLRKLKETSKCDISTVSSYILMLLIGNSNLPTARLLWGQTSATLAKAIDLYLNNVGKSADAELKTSMMDGYV